KTNTSACVPGPLMAKARSFRLASLIWISKSVPYPLVFTNSNAGSDQSIGLLPTDAAVAQG
ncbi:MAG: hypothetical protein ABJQ21_20655, partial [Roseibium sp.]